MANVIKIKRGAEVPTTNAQLAPGEIGFNTTDNSLYINKGTDIAPDIVRVDGIRRPDVVTANLSSPGWYRVAKFDATGNARMFSRGGIIDIEITRTYSSTNNEAHKVTLIASYTTVNFFNQKTFHTQLIKGIRWQYDETNCYLDIYYSGTVTNPVHFSVTSVNAPSISFTNYEPFTDVTSEATIYGSTSNLSD